jgi:translation initiation factor IF-2
VPGAGDQLMAMEADRATEIAQTRQRLEREKRMRIKSRGVKLTDISKMLERARRRTLNLVIKGDVDGSVQALSDSLEQLSTPEVGAGHPPRRRRDQRVGRAARLDGGRDRHRLPRPADGERAPTAEREDVDIRLYNIIYEAVAEVRAAMEGLLSPGGARGAARHGRGAADLQGAAGRHGGRLHGHRGELQRRGKIRVIRDGVQIYEGELGSLKRFKDDVREVREGFECGLNITNFNDIKVGDVIECYRVEEVARTLAGTASRGGAAVVVGVASGSSTPGCFSLKEKRSVVKSLKDRLHNEFNVSVAETAHQDVHQRARSRPAWSRDRPEARELGAPPRPTGWSSRRPRADRGFVYDVLLRYGRAR